MSPTRRQERRLTQAFGVWAIVLGSAGCDGEGGGPTPTASQHVLRVQGNGAGSGTVISAEASPQLSCIITIGAVSGTCASAYPSNSAVRLVATPNAGSTFSGWSGDCTGTGQCVVDMSKERTVTATFAVPPVLVFALSLTLSGQGTGTVNSSPQGIGCTLVSGTRSGTCTATYALGTQVTLIAAAASGSSFAGWGNDGACYNSGTNSTCLVSMLQDHIVTAAFATAGPAFR